MTDQRKGVSRARSVLIIQRDEHGNYSLDESDVEGEPGPPLAADQLMALQVVALLVPRRVCEEEIGDALELIQRLQALGAPRWQIRLKIASTVFWVLVNGVRYIVSAVRGREKGKVK